MPGALVVTQTVILAAGYGSRLRSAESEVPKPLMKVGGVPLIAHALEHARVSGCLQALIVIGHEGQRVQAAVESLAPDLELRFVENPDVTTPNGCSLLTVEPLVAERFYLQMADHVFAGAALPKLTAEVFNAGELGRVLVDRTPGADIDIADATKVQLAGDRVLAIGKGIASWDAIDAGCFVLTPAIFDALRQVRSEEPLTVSAGMRQLVTAGSLGSADVQDVEWIDVDTPADHLIAERLLLTSMARTL